MPVDGLRVQSSQHWQPNELYIKRPTRNGHAFKYIPYNLKSSTYLPHPLHDLPCVRVGGLSTCQKMAYCTPCQRHFSDNTALIQHQSNSSAHKHSCDDCDKEFTTWDALKAHYVNSPRHHYCQRCNVHFKKGAKLVKHYVGSHYYCKEHRSVRSLVYHQHHQLTQVSPLLVFQKCRGPSPTLPKQRRS